jgi:hypothetical protein
LANSFVIKIIPNEVNLALAKIPSPQEIPGEAQTDARAGLTEQPEHV